MSHLAPGRPEHVSGPMPQPPRQIGCCQPWANIAAWMLDRPPPKGKQVQHDDRGYADTCPHSPKAARRSAISASVRARFRDATS